MHLLVRETRGLDEAETAVDLGQSRADLVFLSFVDSDLGSAASAWQGCGGALPSLRLANLGKLRHPMSVDLYVEQVIGNAHCVVIRLLGGLDYWRYGAEEVAHACRAAGIPLALLPGDGRDDPRLRSLSTVQGAMLDRLDGYFAQGGPANMGRALSLMAHLAGAAPDHGLPPEPVPLHGVHTLSIAEKEGRPLAVIVFYRAYVLAGDMAPIEALARALDSEGLNARALYVGSLKDRATAGFIEAQLREWHPSVILNATAFSARLDDAPSPLEAAGVPVVGVIEPGAQAACEASASGHIAVIGTEGTVSGRAYDAAILRRRSAARISAIATQLFVALAEEGMCDGPIALAVARHYLAALCAAGSDAPDTLVLGCTHFPMLAGTIRAAIGAEIRIVDSAATTARAVREHIDAAGLRCRAAVSAVRFLATDGAARFARVGSLFLGRPIAPADVELIDL